MTRFLAWGTHFWGQKQQKQTSWMRTKALNEDFGAISVFFGYYSYITVHPSPIPPRRKSKKPRVETPKLKYDVYSKKTHMTKSFEGRILIKAQFSFLVVVV